VSSFQLGRFPGFINAIADALDRDVISLDGQRSLRMLLEQAMHDTPHSAWMEREGCAMERHRLDKLRKDIQPAKERILQLLGEESSTEIFRIAALDVQARAQQMKRAGYKAHVLKAAGCPASAVKGAGYELEELKMAGYMMQDMAKAGFSVQELKRAGFDASALKAAGYDARALKAAGYDASALKAAGYDASATTLTEAEAECVEAELKGSRWRSSGLARDDGRIIVVNEALRWGYERAELTGTILRTGPFISTNDWLVDCAFWLTTQKRRLLTKLQWSNEKECTLSWTRIEAGYDASALKAAGYDARALAVAGYDASALKEAGYDARALKEAGYDARALKEADYDARALKAAGYDARVLKAVGFFPFQCRQAGFTFDEGRVAGYNWDNGEVAWNLPTNAEVARGGGGGLVEGYDDHPWQIQWTSWR